MEEEQDICIDPETARARVEAQANALIELSLVGWFDVSDWQLPED